MMTLLFNRPDSPAAEAGALPRQERRRSRYHVDFLLEGFGALLPARNAEVGAKWSYTGGVDLTLGEASYTPVTDRTELDFSRAVEVSLGHQERPGAGQIAAQLYERVVPAYWSKLKSAVRSALPAISLRLREPSEAVAAPAPPALPEPAMTWGEVQKLTGSMAPPLRFINWKGQAEHPEVAWIITTLAGPGNKLTCPDRLADNHFYLSDERVTEAARRLLASNAEFSLYVFQRVPGSPVRYKPLGTGTVIGYEQEPYPAWVIALLG
jgi:hypothetical protein